MSEGSEDKESKTEQPTPKKLEQALEKGDIINSREVTNFIALVGLTIFSVLITPFFSIKIVENLKFLISNAGTFRRGILIFIFSDVVLKTFLYCTPFFIMVMILPIISNFIQQGQIIFSSEKLSFDLSRLSILKGFQRIFSLKGLMELLKGVVKISIIGVIIYLVISSDIKQLKLYQDFYLGKIISQLHTIIIHIIFYVTLIVLIIAVIDYLYQRYEYFKSLRMTKEEIKDEYKQIEGHPEVKQRIRSLRMQQAQKRILKSVPTANVVITNPQHFAIALKYNMDTMNAPLVIAKGMDLIALKIRGLAEENNIPIVEDPPLAQALYKEGEIDKEIPFHHYEAVAKIISYIYSMKQNKYRK